MLWINNEFKYIFTEPELISFRITYKLTKSLKQQTRKDTQSCYSKIENLCCEVVTQTHFQVVIEKTYDIYNKLTPSIKLTLS